MAELNSVQAVVTMIFHSKYTEKHINQSRQQNPVLDSTLCAVITTVSVADSSFLVLTGWKNRPGQRVCYRRVWSFNQGSETFRLTHFIVLANETETSLVSSLQLRVTIALQVSSDAAAYKVASRTKRRVVTNSGVGGH